MHRWHVCCRNMWRRGFFHMFVLHNHLIGAGSAGAMRCCRLAFNATYMRTHTSNRSDVMQFVRSVLSAIGIGVGVYVLVLVLAGMLSYPQYAMTDAVGIGSNVVNSHSGGVTSETTAVLDVPEDVAVGVPFQYSIGRSTYSAEGVQAVTLVFSDGTVLKYTTGYAPNQGEHVFMQAGRHTVTLTIVDGAGVEHTDTCVVMVVDPASTPGSQEPQTVLV